MYSRAYLCICIWARCWWFARDALFLSTLKAKPTRIGRAQGAAPVPLKDVGRQCSACLINAAAMAVRNVHSTDLFAEGPLRPARVIVLGCIWSRQLQPSEGYRIAASALYLTPGRIAMGRCSADPVRIEKALNEIRYESAVSAVGWL